MDFCYYNIMYCYGGSGGVKKSKGNFTIKNGAAIVVPFSVTRIVQDLPRNVSLKIF